MNLSRFFAPPHPAYATRRQFLARAGGGFGMLALNGLLASQGLASEASVNPLAPKTSHFR